MLAMGITSSTCKLERCHVSELRSERVCIRRHLAFVGCSANGTVGAECLSLLRDAARDDDDDDDRDADDDDDDNGGNGDGYGDKGRPRSRRHSQLTQ